MMTLLQYLLLNGLHSAGAGGHAHDLDADHLLQAVIICGLWRWP